MKNPPTEIITDAGRLSSLCDAIRSSGWCAFDTEFVGEDQFQPELCLIQIASSGGVVLIDPLSGLDVSPIWELIAGDDILVIVHAGSEDIAQCQARIGRPPRRIFDLQIAAGLVGMDYPISLGRLALAITGEKIHKSQTLSNWRQRPLTPEQIRYAVDDVIHLRPIYDRLDDNLNSLHRTDWLWEECQALCRLTSEPEVEAQKLKRLRGAGSLDGRELAVAHALLEEREKLARQYNRPARVVLKDHLLVEIARRGWTDVRKMQTLRGVNLNAAALQRLAETVERARKIPPAAWPELPSQEDTVQEQTLIALLTALLTDFCATHRIAYALLSKKQSLRSLVRGYTRPDVEPTPHPFSAGWRNAAVGGLLADVMKGFRTIRVVENSGGRFQLATETSRADAASA